MSQEKFLTTVAKAIVAEGNEARYLAIVLPNRRAGLFLKQRIAEQVSQPIFLPTILTIEEFFRELSGLNNVETVEQLFYLYQSHKKIAKENGDSFERFLDWAPTFLSDCGEIDTNLINTEVFFKTLYNDREIRNWSITDELTELQIAYLNFWETANLLYNDFTKSLLNNGSAYNGLAYRYAIDQLETAYPKLPYSQAWFVGFNALNQAEKALFEYVQSNQVGRFFWDVDKYYVDDWLNKAGMYFKRYQAQWPNDEQLQELSEKIGNKTEKITIIEAPNNVSQCAVTAQVIEELSKSQELNSNTAIVLSDEKLLEPLLYQLPKELGPYNITMGKSLAQFPLFHLFDDYFALQNAQIVQNEKKAFPTGMLKPILTSSYLKLIDEQAGTILLDQLIEQNSALLWQHNYNELIGDDVGWKDFLRPKASLDEVIVATNTMIEQLRMAFLGTKDRMQIQVLFELKKIVQQFENYSANYPGQMTLSSFRKLFQQVARATKIPFEGEPLQGIQIMGVLETRCLDFEHIIIVSANEDVLPKGQTGKSFIPFVFKAHFNIQTAKDKDAIYAYSFYRLLHFAKTANFIYNGQPNALGGGEVSRFVQQIEAELPQKIEKQIPIERITASFPTYQPTENDYCIEKNEEVLTQIIDYLENRGLSPSSIKTLVNAPLDFYFDKIARIRQPKELEQDIELNTFGTIVHDSLEQLYTPLLGQLLTQDALDDLLEQTEAVVEQQFQRHFKQGDTSRGMNFLQKNASEILVKETIKQDIERIKSHNIKVLHLEALLESTLPVQAFGRTINVRIYGKVDRIQQRDNAIEIIDYKTGKVEKLSIGKISEIHSEPKQEKLHQILCYSLMAVEGELKLPLNQIRPAMQALKSWQSGLTFIENDADFTLEQEQMDVYKEQLQLVIENLLNTDLPFVPEEDEKRLQYSNYKGIYS